MYDDFENNDEFEYGDELKHYGQPRRSGRYPWGSGKESYQRTGDFLARIDELKNKGFTEKELSNAFGLTTTQFRVQQSLAKAERRALEVDRAKGLKEKGYSLQKIAEEMGYANDSSIRSLLNEKSANKMNEAQNVANLLKDSVDKKGMIDVGAGVERELGTSKEKMQQALYMLELEGYPTYTGSVQQVTNKGKQTILKVLCPPGTEYKDIYDTSKINAIKDYNVVTNEVDVRTFKYPPSVNFNRINVRYAEDGGVTKDGTIEIRRGVQDLDLGNSHYAQVRVLVGEKEGKGTHYLKGMAVYKDDSNFPPGVDIIFNTNKSKGTPKEKVFKEIKKDPNNPFGSTIKPDGQYTYTDKKTGKKQMGAINKAREEGDWNNWGDTLPSQFLSKQNKSMIKKQLGLTKADKAAELDEIMSISNPTVRRNLLKSYADDCDASAVHLKAAALPRQRYQVILPIDSLKDNEVYAPNFKDGEQVALIRYPHGGTFEIPILTVNNKNKDAIKMISKNAKDAVCINHKNAERLSGADFDGDTVQVLPHNAKNRITSTKPLEGLKDFDNKREYPAREGMKVMQKGSVGKEMGKISNLITDMTLKGATEEELTRAVKHSMVVIDAYKHKLDYKKSEADNNISALVKKYQTTVNPDGTTHTGGASTLISRAKGEVRVDKRSGTPKINMKGTPWYDPTQPEGAYVYNKVKNVKGTKNYDPTQPEGAYITRQKETYVDHKTGETKVRQEVSKKMMEANDAYSITSGGSKKNPGTIQEELYAEYANSMKGLANEARKAMYNTGNLKQNKEAKVKYASEVSSLNHKLNQALMNAPKERQAQLYANSVIKAKKESNPELEGEDLKKLKTQELERARAKFGAKRTPIEVSDEEWEAIEAGAISDNLLTKILQNADIDVIRQKATPKQRTTLSDAKVSKIRAMRESGYTNTQIAEALGTSVSMILKY